MKTIKIEIPVGFKGAYNEQAGEITFVEIPKSPRERFNGWPDILQFHNMTQDNFERWCAGLRTHEIGTREVELIIAAYNGRQLEDALPEWGSNTGIKGYGIYNMPSPSGAGFSFIAYVFRWSVSYVGARLVFFGDEWKENLLDANKKFISHFEKSLTL